MRFCQSSQKRRGAPSDGVVEKIVATDRSVSPLVLFSTDVCCCFVPKKSPQAVRSLVYQCVGNFAVNGGGFFRPGAFYVLCDIARHHVELNFQCGFCGFHYFERYVIAAVGAFFVCCDVILTAAVVDAFVLDIVGNHLAYAARDTRVEVFQAPSSLGGQIVQFVSAAHRRTLVDKSVLYDFVESLLAIGKVDPIVFVTAQVENGGFGQCRLHLVEYEQKYQFIQRAILRDTCLHSYLSLLTQ